MTRIDTVDQLDALPIGSVIRLGSGQVFIRTDASKYRDDWQDGGGGAHWVPEAVLAEHDGPHALLFVPGRDLVQEAKADAWDECSRTAHLQDHEPYCAPNPYRDEAL